MYERWGVRKHLLDDLYIRFFRLAEERIDENAAHGIVSYISNGSYLAGRSHPLMRERLLRSFDAVWIDNLNGDKYKTGKIIPNGFPGAGTSDQSVFSTAQNPGGIQVGTAITTLVKRSGTASPPEETSVYTRDFWGRADAKRVALVQSLEMEVWSDDQRLQASARPEGPRPYERFQATEQRRWKLVSYESAGGYDDWLAIDELFSVAFQGVNPNRGIHGSVIDTDADALHTRMEEYFSDLTFNEFCARHPELCLDRAGFDAEATRDRLRTTCRFELERITPYALFPLDGRFIYYETRHHLLNRARPDLWDNLSGNEFLVGVPQARRVSESLPLFSSSGFDLHLHDRGSVGFPATVVRTSPDVDLFNPVEEPEATVLANLSGGLWTLLRERWSLEGGLDGEPAHSLVRSLFRVCLAIGHAPAYQDDHRDSLAHDWARIPLPKDRQLMEDLARVGGQVALLLDPIQDGRSAVKDVLGGQVASQLAVLAREGEGAIREEDLMINISYYGAAAGGWRSREIREEEPTHPRWGEGTGDLYINDDVYLRNVPTAIWGYELGGYPVVKKWLGYRHERFRDGAPLTLREKDVLRGVIQRIAAVLALHDRLDELYRRAVADPWTAEDLESVVANSSSNR